MGEKPTAVDEVDAPAFRPPEEDPQKSPAAGIETESPPASSDLLAVSLNLWEVKVTAVNDQAMTFTGAVAFSATNLAELPMVGEIYDISYTEPTPGGALEATSVKSSKSNSSERLVGGDDSREPYQVSGKVTEVSNLAKTFTVEVAFSATNLAELPMVDEIYDISYTEPTPGEPMKASNLNLSKANLD